MAARKDSTQRSDEIRRRRKQRSHTIGKQAARWAGKGTSPSPPPVMSRASSITDELAATRYTGRRSQQAKRRYDVVLNRQGAEMRLPSIPRLRVGWRLASFLLASFLFAMLYQLWTSPAYRVQAAEVFGLRRLASSNVNAVLGVSGKQIFELDPQEMEKDLTDAFPELVSVSIMLDFPQTVVVTATERIPILAWSQDGEVQLVDESGWAFPSRDDPADLAYVVIEAQDDPPPLLPSDGPLPLSALLEILNESDEQPGEAQTVESKPYITAVPFLSPQMVSTILTLAEQAPQGAVLTYDTRHGLGWQDLNNLVVYFGDSQDIQMKLIVYQAILDHLAAADTLPALISVEYVHAPYYRLEP